MLGNRLVYAGLFYTDNKMADSDFTFYFRVMVDEKNTIKLLKNNKIYINEYSFIVKIKQEYI